MTPIRRVERVVEGPGASEVIDMSYERTSGVKTTRRGGSGVVGRGWNSVQSKHERGRAPEQRAYVGWQRGAEHQGERQIGRETRRVIYIGMLVRFGVRLGGCRAAIGAIQTGRWSATPTSGTWLSGSTAFE